MRKRRSAARLGRALFVLPVAAVSQQLLANTGVQLPLNQYQAGAEQTTNIPNGNFSSRTDADSDGRFETAPSWNRFGNMFVDTTVNPPANTAATSPFSAQARLDGGQPNQQTQHSYTQPVDRSALTTNANYVLSGYVWNMGRVDPSGFGGGELASIKIQDANNPLNNVSATLEANGSDGQTGATGRFIYILTNESQLRAWGAPEIGVIADVGTVTSSNLPEVWAQFDNVSLTRSDAFVGQKWVGTAGGNWGDSTQWLSGFIPNGAGSVGSLVASAAPQTVTLDAARTIGILHLGGAGSYTLTGAALTLDVTQDGLTPPNAQGLPEIAVDSGSHTVSAPVTMARNGILNVQTGANLNVTSNLTTNNVSLTKIGGGKATVTNVRTGTAGVAVNAGTLQVAPNSTTTGVSKVTSLAIAPTAKFDLTDNKLITSDPAGNASGGVYNGVQGQVQRAYGNGTFNGAGGLTTSMPQAAEGLTTIAVVTGEQYGNATFMGQSVAPSDSIAMYTYGGDTNLDGQVTGDDYGTIDFAILVPGAEGYYNGDFNYDGVINGDDYGVIDFTIIAQGPQFPHGDAASASGVTAVPEPTTLGATALALLALRRRRRQV